MTPNHSSITEFEREVLAALCDVALAAASREPAIRALVKYEWTSPDHRVIFEALRRTGHGHLAESHFHERLKAEVTRLGFPDIEWDLYFEAAYRDASDVDARIRELLNTAPDAS